MWHWFVSIHQSGSWGPLIGFYGVVVSVIVFVCLQLMLVRGRRAALSALEQIRKLTHEVSSLGEQLDEAERRLADRLDSRSAGLETRMTNRLETDRDQIEELVESHRAALAESMSGLGARISHAEAQLERLVRGAPATAQSAAAKPVDVSLAAALGELRSELQQAIGRVERLENLLHGAKTEEPIGLEALEEILISEPLSEEEAEFEEWEQEAKELAESEDAEAGLERAFAPSPPPVTGPETAYPAEMGETGPDGASDDLEADLPVDEVELPEIDDDEELDGP